jgi:2-polyprenyl-3-methyl-5-hydroxy-6-metoxy-1,4-benzoquinol methylase
MTEKWDARMKQDWDERARSNAMHFIASGETQWEEERFFESGEANVRNSVTNELDLISRGHEPSELSMLEIGCGIGRMTRHLAQIFGEVYAVDVSGEMIQQAHIKLGDLSNVHLYETSGSDLAPLGDQTMDFA